MREWETWGAGGRVRLTGPDSVRYRWAAEYRLSDLDVRTDPEVRQRIGELGITLCSLHGALPGRSV